MVAAGMLEGLGYSCDVVADGGAALEALANGSYDLLLVDCNMPVLNGFKVTHHIRAREAENGGRRVPIAALTASVLAEERQRCLDIGMDDVLTKPVSTESLAALVERWVPPRP